MPHHRPIRQRVRSAITGRFVPLTTARRDPASTITEQIPDAERRMLGALLERDAAVAVLQELADVLERITADPYRTATGVVYGNFGQETHHRAAQALGRAERFREEHTR